MDYIEKFAYEVIGIVDTYRVGHLTRGKLLEELESIIKCEHENKYSEQLEATINRLDCIVKIIDGDLLTKDNYNVTIALKELSQRLKETMDWEKKND